MTDQKENNALLAACLASVLALFVGINIGWLLAQGYDANEMGSWFQSLAQGKDPREALVVIGAEKLLQEVTNQ